MRGIGPYCIMVLAVSLIMLFYYFSATTSLDVIPKEIQSLVNKDPQLYAIVVDAGSSGSRIYVYCIPSITHNSSKLPAITLCADLHGKQLTKKVTPGLSSFPEKLSLLDSYILDLIRLASDHIPKELHSSTPVYILATAGMRLLSQKKQEQIWQRVRSIMKNEFDFKFEDSWAQTVSGLHEALFGWITVNYLLGKFSISPDHAEDSVGMLDMGGASMQIAYEVPLTSDIPKDSYMDFKVGSGNATNQKQFRVYVMTFLSYGTQATKTRYKVALLHDAMEYSMYSRRLKARFRPSTGYVKSAKVSSLDVELVFGIDGTEKFIISDPCMQPGLEDSLTLEDLAFSRTLSTQAGPMPLVVFKGTGNLMQCQGLQQSLLKTKTVCERQPCSMNGVHQPVIDFRNKKFYAMSEYWYTSSDLRDKVNIYNSNEFHNSVEKSCKTPWLTSLEAYQAKNIQQYDLKNKQGLCFKASWIMNVLHNGFGFPADYQELHIVDQISGIEVQWSLGAFIYYMQQSPLHAPGTGDKVTKTISSLFTNRQTVSLIILVGFFVSLLLTAYVCLRWRNFRPRWFARVKAVFNSSPMSSTSISPKVVRVESGGGDGNHYTYSKLSQPVAYHQIRPPFEDGISSSMTTMAMSNRAVNLRSSVTPLSGDRMLNV